MSATKTIPVEASRTETSVQASQNDAKPEDNSFKSLLAGGVGGICTVMVGYPFELVKVKMQTSEGGRSMGQVVRNTFRNGGVLAFYRGVPAHLVGVMPIFSLSFWGFDTGKRLMQWTLQKEELTTLQLCAASLFSSFATTVVMTPMDQVKVLMQTQKVGAGGVPQYSGTWDCTQHIYRREGLRGLYKGTIATLARDVPGFMTYFVVYELAKDALMRWYGIDPRLGSISPVPILTAGGLGGVAAWAVIFPIDTIKSRFQKAPEGTYRGIWDVYQELVRREGYAALYRGVRPALFRAFPANAACFMGMEVTKKIVSSFER
mmetsp:Transcript_4366/g.7549  ORF Transcript_4366/g.7549 Transcript_4366/m.7549 type:complete len:318 (+) Transcript_4366:78-1031(+)